MGQSRFLVAITADDKTAKGARAAEKRLGQIGKKVANDNRAAFNRFQRDAARANGSVIRSIGMVERSASRAFGRRSVMAPFIERMGAIREATAAASDTMSQAAANGGILMRAMAGVGTIGAATTATLLAAGAAAYKLTSNWAQAGAEASRLSKSIGIATKDLMAFEAAAARVGVDKGTADAALANIARTVHDAYYGRNASANFTMRKLGIQFRKGADGNLDYMATTADIADAIAKQRDPQTAALVAEQFGATGALPLLRQGSGTLRRELADVTRRGPVMTDAEAEKAAAVQRRKTIGTQMIERAAMKGGGWLGERVEPIMGRLLDGGAKVQDGAKRFDTTVRQDFKPAAEKGARAADKLDTAASRIANAFASGGIIAAALAAASETPIGSSRFSAGRTWSDAKVKRLAAKGQKLRELFEDLGLSRDAAAAAAANAMAESSGNPWASQGRFKNAGKGLFQWDDARQADFAKWAGFPITDRRADARKQAEFFLFELQNKERPAGRAIAAASGPGGIADAITRSYERPANPNVDAPNRAALAEEIARQANAQPLKVVVEHKFDGLPDGARVRSRDDRGRSTVHYSMPTAGGGGW